MTTIYTGTNAGTYFPAYDGNGNIVAYINAENGTIVAEYEYGPFGELIRASGKMAKEFNILFSTKYYDWETGLYYYGYRYYSPIIGRWLSRDPIGENRGMNLYGFTQNGPISRFDPFGQTWAEAIALFGDWITGAGDPFRNYGPESNQAKDMKDVPGVNKARDSFRNKNMGIKCCGDLKPLLGFGVKFGLKGLWEAGANSTRQFIGSYTVNIIPRKTPYGKPCEVRILIFNTTSMTSFFYGLSPSWERKWFFSPGGNMRQRITWTETYSL